MRSNFLLVALFLSGLIAQSASAQDQSIIPHLANGLFPGGSFRTTFIVVNNTDSTTTAVLRLTGDNGDPLAVTILGLWTDSTFNLTLAPGATRILQTDGSGNLVTGAATIGSSAPVGASAVFTMFNPQGNFLAEAGVGDSPSLSEFTLPVDETSTFNTGVAFYNPLASAVTLSLRLLDADGTVVGDAQLTLPPRNHLARFVSQIFHSGNCTYNPDCTSNLQGSIAVTGSDKVAALVLRQKTAAGTPTYTSLPITPGVSQGYVPPVLLSRSETGVAVASDVTLNATLPAGVKLTGTVSPAAYTPEARVFAQSADNVFSGSVDRQTGKYLIILPAGSYNLTARYNVYLEDTDTIQSPRVFVTASGGSVQVSGNTTKDISLPGVNLFSVSGTVAGLDMLPAPSTGGNRISFSSVDNTITGIFPLNEATGAWQGELPSGTYRAGISVASGTGNQTQTINASSMGFLTVDSGPATGGFTVPPTAQISGTLTLAGNATGSTNTQVFANDAGGWGSNAVPDAAGNYRMTVANHRTYRVGVTSYAENASILSALNEVHVTGDTSLDLLVPELQRTVTLSGRVTDPSGRPVVNSSVMATSNSIAGAPGIWFSQRGETDAGGDYSITVPSGTYDVTFIPRSIVLSAVQGP